MESSAPNRLATLGHPQRLSVFRLLMRRYPDKVPATEIATALSLKPNTLSTYVSALMKADLVTQERAGTSLRYSANVQSMKDTLDYLLIDCCRGRPEVCGTLPLAPKTSNKYKVLFLCTGNSARSIFAESILTKEAGDRFEAYSAGTTPGSELNPFALDVLTSKGYDTSSLRSKNVTEFQGDDALDFDFVFTVCNQAANEECPPWPGQPISAHWGMVDPVKAEGSDAEKSIAFQQAYGALRNRIIAFTSLPFAALDRMSLQKALDDIGATE